MMTGYHIPLIAGCQKDLHYINTGQTNLEMHSKIVSK
jgi:hypothetical protein